MIKFGDVKIGETARRHINECLDKNWVTMGEKVKLFEKEWARIAECQYSVAVNSGTSAVLAMCASLYDYGAEPGDEIIVPALSFCSTWNAVIAAGFTPIPVDVDLDTLNIDPKIIKYKISDRTRAILAVALMGKPFDAIELRDIANEHNLRLFGDCCESHLCKHNKDVLESYADACAYSFFSAHAVFSCEMGSVNTNQGHLVDIFKSVRSHGRQPDSLYFDHSRFGLNLKPTDIHASVGLEGLENIEENMAKRRNTLYKINKFLFSHDDKIHIVNEDNNDINCPHAISITFRKESGSRERDVEGENIANLKCLLTNCKLSNGTSGIEWKRNFGAISQHKAFTRFDHIRLGDYPNAEWIGNHGIHLPCHAYLTESDVFEMMSVLEYFFDKIYID